MPHLPITFGCSSNNTIISFRRTLTTKGPSSLLQDAEFKAAGAQIVPSHDAALAQDIVLKVRPPTMDEVDKLKEHAK